MHHAAPPCPRGAASICRETSRGHGAKSAFGRVGKRRGNLGHVGHRPVSSSRSSNRTCRFLASGSPSDFTRRHAACPPWPSCKSLRGSVSIFSAVVRFITNSAHRHLLCKHVAGRGLSLHRHYPASSVLWPPPTSGPSVSCRDVRVATPTDRISPVARKPFSGVLLPLPRWTRRVLLSILPRPCEPSPR
jgi:hypothetical protein